MSENEVIVSLVNRVRIIKFNRPHRKNAMSLNTYDIISDTLKSDAVNDEVVLTILTGVGEYFSSGYDLKTVRPKHVKKSDVYQQVPYAFIQYPKLIIAVVNGPAIGLAVAILPLCDVVYASDRATFSTPFLKLSFPSDGASSYTFPRIMGNSTAMEMLLLGKTLTAEEALRAKLISKIIPHEQLEDKIKQLMSYAKLNPQAIITIKKLIVNQLKDTLLEVNKNEYEILKKAYASGAVKKSIALFFKEKSKL